MARVRRYSTHPFRRTIQCLFCTEHRLQPVRETCEETIRRYVPDLRNAKKGIVGLADHFRVQEDRRDLYQDCRTCELNA